MELLPDLKTYANLKTEQQNLTFFMLKQMQSPRLPIRETAVKAQPFMSLHRLVSNVPN